MIIGIHPDQTGSESYSKKFTEYFAGQNISTKTLNLLGNNAIKQAEECDGIMWRWLHRPGDKQSAKSILHTIEHHLHIPVFPNSTTAWHYDDKVAQHYLLSAMQVPCIKTWVFWDYQEAVRWLEQATFPVIFKLSAGAGSANVLKIAHREHAKAMVHQIFNKGVFPYTYHEYRQRLGWLKKPGTIKQRLGSVLNLLLKSEYPPLDKIWWKPEFGYAYFQEFLPDNKYDTRVTVIGSRAFAFKRFNRPGDFRASGSGNFDVSPYKIDLECVKTAFAVSKEAGFQSMAYDFLYDPDNRPLIVEMSYTFVDWAVQSCPGHWDEKLNWVEGNMWPEEAIAEDFLNSIKSKAK